MDINKFARSLVATGEEDVTVLAGEEDVTVVAGEEDATVVAGEEDVTREEDVTGDEDATGEEDITGEEDVIVEEEVSGEEDITLVDSKEDVTGGRNRSIVELTGGRRETFSGCSLILECLGRTWRIKQRLQRG